MCCRHKETTHHQVKQNHIASCKSERSELATAILRGSAINSQISQLNSYSYRTGRFKSNFASPVPFSPETSLDTAHLFQEFFYGLKWQQRQLTRKRHALWWLPLPAGHAISVPTQRDDAINFRLFVVFTKS